MEFNVTTDSWFVFSVLFTCAMALFMVIFVAIPFFSRAKTQKRRRAGLKRRAELHKRIADRTSERQTADLHRSNTKLQTDLKNDLEKSLKDQPNGWDHLSFYSNFEKVYPDFGASLSQLIPNITANELKLCAYLRLNLSSKEIGQLLNITPESVNKARYRLRKKLELNTNEDLFLFLSNV